MRIKNLHPWNVTPAEAVRIQNDLCRLVSLDDVFGPIQTIAGVDVGLSQANETATGGIVVLSFPGLELIETAFAAKPVEFPYIPGLLAFREIPAILDAFKLLKAKPDIMIVDGQGLAHQRRFGIACHLGVLLDLPSIGCGKSRLIGNYEEPGPEPGDSSPLMADSEQLGNVVRTKFRVKPVFISPGHRIGFTSAVEVTLSCVRGYRLPEPVRLAHNLVSRGK
ncbi:MAG: deoxyribonuclease V [Armatimonadota bacterium]